MVHMLLTECMVRICQYRTYRRGQEGMFLAWGLTDEDINLLRGVDWDILAQGIIGLIDYRYHQGYTFFSGSPTEKKSEVKRALSGEIS
jgi:hypothetical protein